MEMSLWLKVSAGHWNSWIQDINVMHSKSAGWKGAGAGMEASLEENKKDQVFIEFTCRHYCDARFFPHRFLTYPYQFQILFDNC